MHHLRKDTNYIVSGLERSGTSLMMQILDRAGIPVEYDNSRASDKNNPLGYYELFSGKIINYLVKGNSNILLDRYLGKFIKITAYGLTFLPENRKYMIVYMERNIDEILDSMDKMIGYTSQPEVREKNRDILIKLNMYRKKELDVERIPYIIINYNKLLSNPLVELKKINKFLSMNLDLEEMSKAIRGSLYRNRR